MGRKGISPDFSHFGAHTVEMAPSAGSEEEEVRIVHVPKTH